MRRSSSVLLVPALLLAAACANIVGLPDVPNPEDSVGDDSSAESATGSEDRQNPKEAESGTEEDANAREATGADAKNANDDATVPPRDEASSPPDTGTLSDGKPPADTSSPPIDSASPEDSRPQSDASSPPDDSRPPADTSSPPLDSAPPADSRPPADTSPPLDSTTPPIDTGPPPPPPDGGGCSAASLIILATDPSTGSGAGTIGNFGTTGSVCVKLFGGITSAYGGWFASNVAGRTLTLNGVPTSVVAGAQSAVPPGPDGYATWDWSAGTDSFASMSFY